MKRILLLLVSGLYLTTAHAQNTGIGTVSPTDQLHTTGTVRFQNYSGLGTRLMYLDSAGRVSPPPTGALFTNNTRYSIPDNGCTGNNGASSAIAVTGLATSVPASKISVRLNITHTFDGDLKIFLIAPTGNVLLLANAVGSTGDDFTGSIFTDDAPDVITTAAYPFTGRYKPAGTGVACLLTANVSAFSALGTGGNINPNGTWTLKVFDNANLDTGSIQNWQITFDGQGGFGTTGATGPVPYFNNGNLSLSAISNTAAGNVGIGTANPLAKLDVAGSVRIADGTQGTGKILTSNATGIATWQTDAPLNSGFLASITSGVTIPSTGFNYTVLPFTSNSTTLPCFDDAGAFNNTTYTFTAPTAGVYHFDVSVNTGLTTATAGVNVTLVSVINGVANGPQHQTYTASGDYIPLAISYSFDYKLAANATVKIGMVVLGMPGLNSIGGNRDTYFSAHRIY